MKSERWCIIGAGFSGLTMAATLQQHRIPFTILEREESLGGNWTYGVFVFFFRNFHLNMQKFTTGK